MSVVLVGVGALIASMVQATTGLGFALILTPMLFATMAPIDGIVTTTALGLMLNLLVLLGEHRRPSVVWPEVTPIVLAAVPGSACGLVLLESVPKAGLQVIVGIAVICAAAVRPLAARRASSHASPRGPAVWPRLSLGFAAGTLSTSTGINGPPLALWLSARGLSSDHLRDSLSALFISMGSFAALLLIPALHRAHLHPVELAAAGTAVLIGHAIGRRTFAQLTHTAFQHGVLVMILASGIVSLALGLSALA